MTPRKHSLSSIYSPLLLITLISMIVLPSLAPAQDHIPPCDSEPAFHWLDFWLGDWDVFMGDKQVGENSIEKILDGCAITENWAGGGGSRGQSLFYYQPMTETWRQVWVTPFAMVPGGMKEKQLTERFPDGGVRFQGTIPTSDSTSYLDRTTLTPISPDSVRQVIEVSKDDGASWTPTFDATYVRKK